MHVCSDQLPHRPVRCSIYVGKQRITHPINTKAGFRIAAPYLQGDAGRMSYSFNGAEYNHELDLYTVDCDSISSQPGIRIILGTLDWTVPAKDFIVQMVRGVSLVVLFPLSGACRESRLETNNFVFRTPAPDRSARY